MISEPGLRGAKGRNSPGHRPSQPDPSSAKFGPDQTAAYRSTAARIGFLAGDRWALRFASKECLRSTQTPTITDLQKLWHIGRYFITYPRIGQLFAWQDPVTFIDSIGDTGHAGCTSIRKGTNCGAIMKGKHGLHAWSTMQSLPSLSSGESKWYGLTKTCAEGLGIQSGASDLGDELGFRGWSDATAALGIAKRQGAGKLKQVESRYLWVQYAVKQGRLTLHKEMTQTNKGDAFTKYPLNPDLMKHIKATGFVIPEGRHSLAPKLTVDLTLMNKTSPLLLMLALSCLTVADAGDLPIVMKENINALELHTEFYACMQLLAAMGLVATLVTTHIIAYVLLGAEVYGRSGCTGTSHYHGAHQVWQGLHREERTASSFE